MIKINKHDKHNIKMDKLVLKIDERDNKKIVILQTDEKIGHLSQSKKKKNHLLQILLLLNTRLTISSY